jgi:hypothetical protein
MILITFSVDLGTLETPGYDNHDNAFEFRVLKEYGVFTYHQFSPYFIQKYIYNDNRYMVYVAMLDHVYLIFSPNDGLHLCVGTPHFPSGFASRAAVSAVVKRRFPNSLGRCHIHMYSVVSR